MEVGLIMTNFELQKLLKEKYIIDSYQFLSTCEFKIFSSEISYKALTNICVEQFNKFDTQREELFKNAFETGMGTIKAEEDEIDYFGVKVNRDVLIDKLTIEIFSTLHSFFDTYAQLLNSALFANKSLKIKDVSFTKVIDNLDSFPEYTGTFISLLKSVKQSSEFTFITDINNIVKHRFQIYTQTKFNLFDGNKNLIIPKFRKGNNVYTEKELLDIIKDCFDYCKNLLKEFVLFVESYFSLHDNNYVSNRVYNPKTQLVFDNKEDAKNLKNPMNSIHFIELDKNNLEQEYRILLLRIDEESERIELYNSIYDLIAVKDIVSKEFIGILKPKDSETYSIDDGRITEYRKYEFISTDYDRELTIKMLDRNFQMFPLLSDLEIMIINPNPAPVN